MLRLDIRDRRRILVAALITLVALPAIWIASRSDSGAPNIATAGVEVSSATPDEPATTFDPMGDPSGGYLDGPSTQPGSEVITIAVPDLPDGDVAVARASFRSSISSPGVCLAAPAPFGSTVVVTNLDNDRSVVCVVRVPRREVADEVVLHPDAFARIADLTEAPIHVELRW